MRNQSVIWPLLSVYDVSTVSICKNPHELLVVALQMKPVVTDWEAVAWISLAHLHIMGANSSFIGVCNQEPFSLPEMQDQKSLTLRWRSFSSWGREHVACSFAYQGCQYCIYVYSLPSCVYITRLAGPKIIDSPLTHMFKIGQGAFCIIFSLYRMPTLLLCIFTTKLRLYYTTYNTKHHWRSVDAHFAMAISTIDRHVIGWNISLTIFWQSFCFLQVLSSLSLHCSLIIRINRFFKTCYKVSGNCRWCYTRKLRSLRSKFVFTGSFTPLAAVICKMDVSCITMQQIVY